MDVINRLLRRGKADFGKCSDEKVALLKFKAVTLIKCLVEDNGETAIKLAKQIIAVLDIEAVFETMVQIFPFFWSFVVILFHFFKNLFFIRF